MNIMSRMIKALNRPPVNPALWYQEPKFTGSSFGQYYTSMGRGGQPIAHPMNLLQGAVYYTPKLAVNSLTTGVQVAGSYGTTPLATPASNNA